MRLRGRKYRKAEEECVMMRFLIGTAREGGQMERSETAGCMESKSRGAALLATVKEEDVVDVLGLDRG